MSGDEQPCVDKLQQDEGSNDIKPTGAPAATVWRIHQLDLPAAVVEQHHPGSNEATCDCNALGIVARGPAVADKNRTVMNHKVKPLVLGLSTVCARRPMLVTSIVDKFKLLA